MIAKSKSSFKYSPFSIKQKKILSWWLPNSPFQDFDVIIADGTIRSGKSLSMALSYVFWAMYQFDDELLGLAGKTIDSFIHNVLTDLIPLLKLRGYKVVKKDKILIITYQDKRNYFEIFGGKDEASRALIQGRTLAGMYFDEVALMPESFVEQAVGRCSVEGAKIWFNCNPEHPKHWFRQEWILKKDEKNAFRLRFKMDDNLSLSEKVKERYKRMYAGTIFYSRFIEGDWTSSDGVIYSMFSEEKNIENNIENKKFIDYVMACDYGTQNPFTIGLWGKELNTNIWFKLDEYYYCGRDKGIQKTDKNYADEIIKWINNKKLILNNFDKRFGRTYEKEITFNDILLLVDPSASSFIAELKQRGALVKKAKNDVLDGIRMMSVALNLELIKYSKECKHTLEEFGSYIWDKKALARGEETPLKENDHCLDSDRYFVLEKLSYLSDGIRKLKR